jgi:hypothetical protein
MVHVRLVDAFNSAPVPFTDAQGASATEFAVGPVPVGERVKCS